MSSSAGGAACYLLSMAILGTGIGLLAFLVKPAFLALFLLWLLLGPCLTPDERVAARRSLAGWLGQIRGRLARS